MQIWRQGELGSHPKVLAVLKVTDTRTEDTRYRGSGPKERPPESSAESEQAMVHPALKVLLIQVSQEEFGFVLNGNTMNNLTPFIVPGC